MLSVSGLDGMILSFAQLIQPANPGRIYAFAKGTLVPQLLTEAEFLKRFRQLEREGFLWRTAGDTYVVTPAGEPLVRSALDARQRDKLRLLILNRERYFG
jgi:uncharacterized protein YjhX (UPF0386 family)